jgi:catechol 2,3-dioxygenase-like lactoylglutathione lyase family enzyme
MKENDAMARIRVALALLPVIALVATLPKVAQAADYHHVHITASSPAKGIEWYSDHLGCEPLADRDDAANCYGVEVVFVPQSTTGGTQGTGINHIGFSVPDLPVKMAELEAVGVRGSGVRLQRFEDGSMVRDVPGLFKIAFIFDPWGTRIELVEDNEYLGFHHVHLSATDPDATLAFYRDVMGGEEASLRGRLHGLRFDDTWLLVSAHPEGATPAMTEGRAIDHIGFVVDDLDTLAASMRQAGVRFQEEPVVPENGRTQARRSFVVGPDSVRIAVVETGFAGVAVDLTPVIRRDTGPYDAPRTPWGEPDLQAIWTSNSSHGIPLERPEGIDATELTVEEAVARREGGTLGSVWGYEREWRDTTLGYGGATVSTQVAMLIDPPDGRLPALTPRGEQLTAELNELLRIAREGPFSGPQDIPPDDRCITGGLPRLMLPRVYNNGLQIVQGPGYVAITKEMIHETRVIPTETLPTVGPDLTQWLGVPQGRWEEDTLVVETTNFNGRVSYLGSSGDLTLTERYTRVGRSTLEYEFTVNDPTVWTAMFRFESDDEQYELVEYACHEGNYSLPNMLTGSQAKYGTGEEESGR